jgi:uncharacterized protein (DUF1015 family)
MFTPFPGLLFDPDTIAPSSGATTSPPYDVISADDRTVLVRSSPYNVARLLLPEGGEERYQQAAAALRDWRAAGILRTDPTPRFYIYEMTYTSEEGAHQTARGVLGSLIVEPLGDRIVGHEETMAKHRADRMALLSSTEANLDLIVALSSAPDLALLLEPTGQPRLEFDAGGIHHRLFDVSEPQQIAAIAESVAAHGVSIADGHHRYTTALAYAADRDPDHRGGPWDGILTFLAPAEGSGLRVAPYHRVFPVFPFDAARVAAGFEVEPIAPAPPDRPGDLVVVEQEAGWLLRPRPEALATLPAPLQAASAAVARDLLYPLLDVSEDHAWYTPNARQAIAEAPRGGAALLVAPVPEASIARASEAGVRFPQKSTYFTPKPRAGLVIRVFDAD